MAEGLKYLTESNASRNRFVVNWGSIIEKYDKEFPESDIIDLTDFSVVENKGELISDEFQSRPFGSCRFPADKKRHRGHDSSDEDDMIDEKALSHYAESVLSVTLVDAPWSQGRSHLLSSPEDIEHELKVHSMITADEDPSDGETISSSDSDMFSDEYQMLSISGDLEEDSDIKSGAAIGQPSSCQSSDSQTVQEEVKNPGTSHAVVKKTLNFSGGISPIHLNGTDSEDDEQFLSLGESPAPRHLKDHRHAGGKEKLLRTLRHSSPLRLEKKHSSARARVTGVVPPRRYIVDDNVVTEPVSNVQYNVQENIPQPLLDLAQEQVISVNPVEQGRRYSLPAEEQPFLAPRSNSCRNSSDRKKCDNVDGRILSDRVPIQRRSIAVRHSVPANLILSVTPNSNEAPFSTPNMQLYQLVPLGQQTLGAVDAVDQHRFQYTDRNDTGFDENRSNERKQDASGHQRLPSGSSLLGDESGFGVHRNFIPRRSALDDADSRFAHSASSNVRDRYVQHELMGNKNLYLEENHQDMLERVNDVDCRTQQACINKRQSVGETAADGRVQARKSSNVLNYRHESETKSSLKYESFQMKTNNREEIPLSMPSRSTPRQPELFKQTCEQQRFEGLKSPSNVTCTSGSTRKDENFCSPSFKLPTQPITPKQVITPTRYSTEDLLKIFESPASLNYGSPILNHVSAFKPRSIRKELNSVFQSEPPKLLHSSPLHNRHTVVNKISTQDLWSPELRVYDQKRTPARKLDHVPPQEKQTKRLTVSDMKKSIEKLCSPYGRKEANVISPSKINTAENREHQGQVFSNSVKTKSSATSQKPDVVSPKSSRIVENFRNRPVPHSDNVQPRRITLATQNSSAVRKRQTSSVSHGHVVLQRPDVPKEKSVLPKDDVDEVDGTLILEEQNVHLGKKDASNIHPMKDRGSTLHENPKPDVVTPKTSRVVENFGNRPGPHSDTVQPWRITLMTQNSLPVRKRQTSSVSHEHVVLQRPDVPKEKAVLPKDGVDEVDGTLILEKQNVHLGKKDPSKIHPKNEKGSTLHEKELGHVVKTYAVRNPLQTNFDIVLKTEHPSPLHVKLHSRQDSEKHPQNAGDASPAHGQSLGKQGIPQGLLESAYAPVSPLQKKQTPCVSKEIFKSPSRPIGASPLQERRLIRPVKNKERKGLTKTAAVGLTQSPGNFKIQDQFQALIERPRKAGNSQIPCEKVVIEDWKSVSNAVSDKATGSELMGLSQDNSNDNSTERKPSFEKDLGGDYLSFKPNLCSTVICDPVPAEIDVESIEDEMTESEVSGQDKVEKWLNSIESPEAVVVEYSTIDKSCTVDDDDVKAVEDVLKEDSDLEMKNGRFCKRIGSIQPKSTPRKTFADILLELEPEKSLDKDKMKLENVYSPSNPDSLTQSSESTIKEHVALVKEPKSHEKGSGSFDNYSPKGQLQVRQEPLPRKVYQDPCLSVKEPQKSTSKLPSERAEHHQKQLPIINSPRVTSRKVMMPNISERRFDDNNNLVSRKSKLRSKTISNRPSSLGSDDTGSMVPSNLQISSLRSSTESSISKHSSHTRPRQFRGQNFDCEVKSRNKDVEVVKVFPESEKMADKYIEEHSENCTEVLVKNRLGQQSTKSKIEMTLGQSVGLTKMTSKTHDLSRKRKYCSSSESDFERKLKVLRMDKIPLKAAPIQKSRRHSRRHSLRKQLMTVSTDDTESSVREVSSSDELDSVGRKQGMLRTYVKKTKGTPSRRPDLWPHKVVSFRENISSSDGSRNRSRVSTTTETCYPTEDSSCLSSCAETCEGEGHCNKSFCFNCV